MAFTDEQFGELKAGIDFMVISVSRMNEYRNQREEEDKEEREKSFSYRENMAKTVGSIEEKIINLNNYVIQCDSRDAKKEKRLTSLESSRNRTRGAMGILSAIAMFFGWSVEFVSEHPDKLHIIDKVIK